MTMNDGERIAYLTGPGGAFPLVKRTIDGRELELFDRDPRTMRDAFVATREHDGLALGYRDEHWTYAEFWSAVAALAHALRAAGAGKGDLVGIAMRNYPEFVFSFWATQVIGAVAVPFNAWLKTDELGELVSDQRPKIMIADEERVRLLASIDRRAVGLETLVGVRMSCPHDGVLRYEDFVAEHLGAGDLPDVDVTPADASTMLFTSGTTAKPKAVLHTHLNHSASLLNKYIRAVRVIEETDGAHKILPPAPSTKLVTYPLFHIAGLNTLYTAAFSGHAMILMYKWDAAEALRLIESEGVNELSGSPFVIQTFLEESRRTERDLTSLKMLGLGGSAAPARLIAAIHETFDGRVVPRTGFGMTETTSGVVSISSADFVQRPDSVGRVLPTARVKIVDENGQDLGTDAVGEIAIYGPQVVSGYANVTESDSFRDGWFFSGDLGRIGEDGFVYVVGRLKDVVIRGGENISCSEVERALLDFPDAIEAAAFGAPHPSLGEELVAIVRVQDASQVDGEDIRAFAAGRLAAFKVPVRIAITEQELPRTASGKILKRGIAAAMNVDHLVAAPAG